MIRILACLQDGHDLRLVILAGATALIGSVVSARLFRMVPRERGRRGAWFVVQSAVVGGATIWTTHFVAMLGFDPGVPHGYDPGLTLLSLGIAMTGVLLGQLMIRVADGSRLAEAGGAVMGGAIVAMHFVGMASLQMAAEMRWDLDLVAASAAAGPLLGALAANRVARPRTRLCWCTGAGLFMLAICVAHFTAMGALTVVSTGEAPPAGVELIPDSLLAAMVVCVTALILLVGATSFMIDEAGRREHGERMTHAALHDALTGLPNRANLRRSLARLLRSASALEAGIAVVVVDLDRFKPINDVHGHDAGDHLLARLADRASARLEPGEILGRAGADEFIALKVGAARTEAVDFARRLHQAMTGEVEWPDARLSVGASVGVALAPEHGRDVEALLVRADLAMHRAKAAPDEPVMVYDARMDEASRGRSALTMELKAALANRELELFFQPQNDNETRRIVGFEALLRWRHPVRGLVGPDEFVPLAESTGLIGEIGDWALQEACRIAAGWPAAISIAVNVAPRQLARPDFAETVMDALLVTGLDAGRLELEITEASLIADHERARRVIGALKRAGVRVAMDDYGTGYASLATLKAFPFDKIKIDRSFIQNLPDDRQGAAIVRSTLILGEALEIPVLAEGVETEAQLAFLRRAGCASSQGWLFGRPADRAATEAMIRAQAEADARLSAAG
ncbi:putative bifunctional diguanylate cyclase/phosphodiesterase [Albimonas pacifica]|uniref:Diguanylate cyclase/phosphodiesterase n=1 Tax=Albimonas pacifica TaxID=1114924 RepID=A0A1I3FP66_9RHOB|nr:EAL domain-containing protein [Albimonas pacifica]SFI13058.1 diguanylate cyclase/phosphodiesterase [Albimonas pacifica]